jgi:hypothetical protein
VATEADKLVSHNIGGRDVYSAGTISLREITKFNCARPEEHARGHFRKSQPHGTITSAGLKRASEMF